MRWGNKWGNVSADFAKYFWPDAMDHVDPIPIAGRGVVSDPPGAPSLLTLYTGDQALAQLPLGPAEAVALTSDLLLAARRRYGRLSTETGT